MKRRTCLKRILIGAYIAIGFFALTQKAYSERVLAQGSNIQLYFTNGSTFSFQHAATAYTQFTFNISVISGTLHSTQGKLLMNVGNGQLDFRSQSNGRLSTPHGLMLINGERSDDGVFQVGDLVTIKWAKPGPYDPTLPITFIMGMVGLIGMFGGPAYFIHKMKQREYYDGVRMGVLLTATGLALFIAWLFTT